MKHIVFLGVGANKQKSAGWTNSHYATVVWMHKDAEETIKSGTLRKKKRGVSRAQVSIQIQKDRSPSQINSISHAHNSLGALSRAAGGSS